MYNKCLLICTFLCQVKAPLSAKTAPYACLSNRKPRVNLPRIWSMSDVSKIMTCSEWELMIYVRVLVSAWNSALLGLEKWTIMRADICSLYPHFPQALPRTVTIYWTFCWDQAYTEHSDQISGLYWKLFWEFKPVLNPSKRFKEYSETIWFQ